MSGKTKAELLAENKRLERQIEILTQNLHGLLYDSDRVERDLKIVTVAHKGSITEFINTSNELGRILEKRSKGPQTKQQRDKDKSDYCTSQYEQLLADGIRQDIARRKANEATAKKFGKGYGRTALYTHCPVQAVDK